MKRVCAGILCIIWIFGLFGCGRRVLRPVPPALPDSFSCTLTLTANDLEVKADWSRTPGESVIVILAPQELRGMTVRCTDADARITLDGVEAPLPDTSPFVRLCRAYRTLLALSPEGTQTGQGWLYDLKQTEGFTVLQSADSGLPIRISIPQYSVTAVMTEGK